MRKTIWVIRWIKNEEVFHKNSKSKSFEKSNKELKNLKYAGNIIFIQCWSIFGNKNIINLNRLYCKEMEGNIKMKDELQSLNNSLASSTLKTSFQIKP